MPDSDTLADALSDLFDRSDVPEIRAAVGDPVAVGPLEEHYPDAGAGIYLDYVDGTRFKLTVDRVAL